MALDLLDEGSLEEGSLEEGSLSDGSLDAAEEGVPPQEMRKKEIKVNRTILLIFVFPLYKHYRTILLKSRCCERRGIGVSLLGA